MLMLTPLSVIDINNLHEMNAIAENSHRSKITKLNGSPPKQGNYNIVTVMLYRTKLETDCVCLFNNTLENV